MGSSFREQAGTTHARQFFVECVYPERLAYLPEVHR